MKIFPMKMMHSCKLYSFFHFEPKVDQAKKVAQMLLYDQEEFLKIFIGFVEFSIKSDLVQV